jgi:hypothetical protein
MWAQSKQMGAQRCGVCVYCGLEKELTVDHVPPRLLLSQPYPPNLLTVPSCYECNQSHQANDEYTRLLASIDVRASDQHDVQLKLPAVLRSLERPDAKAFSDYVKSRMRETTILGSDGKPMGHELKVDKARINATGARIVRGLFFIETGKPLSPKVFVRVASNINVRPSDPTLLQLARVYKSSSDHRNREIGSAFSYVAGLHSNY